MKIQPVIYKPHNPKSHHKIDRLLRYIKHLSGVDVLVVDGPKDPPLLRYPGLANSAFRFTAQSMDAPFLWLEADSIPLKSNFVEVVQMKWDAVQQDTLALMSTDYHSPYDLIGGIGVYLPASANYVPLGNDSDGFDTYIARSRSRVSRTGVIQHFYGHYNSNGSVNSVFDIDRDNFMLREDAVIFHADKNQTIITDYETRRGIKI